MGMDFGHLIPPAPFSLSLPDLRSRLYALTPDHVAQHQEIYELARLHFILAKEGGVPHVYTDVVGCKTVGVGFNMDREDARAEWAQAFGAQLTNLNAATVDVPSFEAVYRGETALDVLQMWKLFDAGLKRREAQLRASYGQVWALLRPNERLATESAYYNGACLVMGPMRDDRGQVIRHPDGTPQGSTRYYGHLERYVCDKTPDGLYKAVEELRDHSNRRGIRGLALRRAEEALLLSSFDEDGFSGWL